MSKIKIKDTEYNVIDSLSDLNLFNYQEMAKIISIDSMDGIEKSIKLAKCLIIEDVSEEDLEELDIDELQSITNGLQETSDNELKSVFQHDGITYELQGDKDNFKFNVRQIKNIYNAMKNDNVYYVKTLAAILYSDGSTNEKRREAIFNEYMTVDYVLPFIQILITKYDKNLV